MNRPILDIEADEYPKGGKGEWIGEVQSLIERDNAAMVQGREGDPASPDTGAVRHSRMQSARTFTACDLLA